MTKLTFIPTLILAGQYFPQQPSRLDHRVYTMSLVLQYPEGEYLRMMATGTGERHLRCRDAISKHDEFASQRITAYHRPAVGPTTTALM